MLLFPAPFTPAKTKIRGISATFARDRDSSLSKLTRCRVERCFHRGASFGCLHPRQEEIELLAQPVEVRLAGAQRRLHLVERNEHRFWSVVFGNYHHSVADRVLQNIA